MASNQVRVRERVYLRGTTQAQLRRHECRVLIGELPASSRSPLLHTAARSIRFARIRHAPKRRQEPTTTLLVRPIQLFAGRDVHYSCRDSGVRASLQ